MLFKNTAIAFTIVCVLSVIPNIGSAQIISFSNGSFGSSAPSIGGYDPSSSARLGFRAGGFSFGIEMGKGSTRSSFVESPSITVPNGYGGSMFNGISRPFVTGIIPVVGNNIVDNSPPVNGVTLALSSGQLDLSNLGDPYKSRSSSSQSFDLGAVNSTASQASDSVAAIKVRKAQEREATKAAYVAAVTRAEEYVSSNDYSKAKTEFRSALRICETDEQKATIKKRLDELRDKR